MGKRPMGGPKVKNPGKLFKRLMAYICKSYTPHCILVVICILASVLCNVQGTMFMQTLIDDYITPLLKSADPDFTPLAAGDCKGSRFLCDWRLCDLFLQQDTRLYHAGYAE